MTKGTPKRSTSASTTPTFDTARELALVMADVEDGTTYRTPALKVRGRWMACIPNHTSSEPGSIALSIGFSERDELLAADPKTYYLPDHYVSYPLILARLGRLDVDALHDLLLMAWRFTSASKPRRTRPRAPSGREP